MNKKSADLGTGGRRMPRSRFQPKVTSGMRLEERDEQILCDLFLHRLMSRSQIERTYFSSLVRCNARLRLLFDHHFVARHYPPYAPFGAQAIYSVGKAALPIVARRLEMELPEVTRFYRRTQTPTFIEHTLSVVDIWLAFRQATEAHDDICFDLWLAELQCRHEWEIRTSGGTWHTEAFKPDAYVRLHRQSDGSYGSFFIESDLGHTSAKQFSGKLLTHQRYLESGLFSQTYGGDWFRTLVITTGQQRLKNLMAVTAQHSSQLFWFTTWKQLGEVSVLDKIWSVPSNEEEIGLVDW